MPKLTVSDALSILAALAYVAGGACMKASGGGAHPRWLVGVYLAFGVGCTLQTLSMAGQDLAVNYIVVLGLEAVAAFAVGWALFGESPTPTRVGGVLLVTIGIALLRA